MTRLGFAVMLKFYEIEGRFPAYREEVPQAVAAYLGWTRCWPRMGPTMKAGGDRAAGDVLRLSVLARNPDVRWVPLATFEGHADYGSRHLPGQTSALGTVARRWAAGYADLEITSYDYLPYLYQNNGYEVVVDPMVYRIGELFLAQTAVRKDGDIEAEKNWSTINEDIGGLATFFDLIILHQQVPAFDYSVTFDPMPDPINLIAGERLSVTSGSSHRLTTRRGQRPSAQLRDRMAKGAFVPAAVARQIPAYVAEVGYQWAPDIGPIETLLKNALELRGKRSVEKYRKIRRAALGLTRLKKPSKPGALWRTPPTA